MSKRTVKLEDLGDVMQSEIGALAKYNKKLVGQAVSELPERTVTLSKLTYDRSGLKRPSGQLRSSTEGLSRRGGSPGEWLVGARNEKNYAVAQHEGTDEYTIKPKGKKALFWPGARHPVKSVRHPGLKARKWVERALRGAAKESMARLKKLIGWQ